MAIIYLFHDCNDQKLATNVWMWDITQFDIEKKPKLIIKFGHPYSHLGFEFPCCHYGRQKVTEIGSPHLIEMAEFWLPHLGASPYKGDWSNLNGVTPSSCIDKQRASEETKVIEMVSPHSTLLLCKGDQGDRKGVTLWPCHLNI